ncbi:MAG: hypothetical protein NTV34_08130 [Proteobacteria bacterium]|nr:hypothetical protein [Pseudomonadota bacterium]
MKKNSSLMGMSVLSMIMFVFVSAGTSGCRHSESSDSDIESAGSSALYSFAFRPTKDSESNREVILLNIDSVKTSGATDSIVKDDSTSCRLKDSIDASIECQTRTLNLAFETSELSGSDESKTTKGRFSLAQPGFRKVVDGTVVCHQRVTKAQQYLCIEKR